MLHCHLPHHMMNQMASTVGPMTRIGKGMQAGGNMEEGMGMLRDGNATSENRGPSLGRALGVGSSTEMLMTNGPLSQSEAKNAMANMPGIDHCTMQEMSGMSIPKLPENSDKVPLFHQDAF